MPYPSVIFHFTFALAVVFFTDKILPKPYLRSCPGYITKSVRCIKLIGTLVERCKCAALLFDIDLVVVTLNFKILSELYLGKCKV